MSPSLNWLFVSQIKYDNFEMHLTRSREIYLDYRILLIVYMFFLSESVFYLPFFHFLKANNSHSFYTYKTTASINALTVIYMDIANQGFLSKWPFESHISWCKKKCIRQFLAYICLYHVNESLKEGDQERKQTWKGSQMG